MSETKIKGSIDLVISALERQIRIESARESQRAIQIANAGRLAFPENLPEPMPDYLGQLEAALSILKGSQWVSVEDRLPEDNQTVIVLYCAENQSKYFTDVAIFAAGEFNHPDTQVEYIQPSIIGWQSLPQPPSQ